MSTVVRFYNVEGIEQEPLAIDLVNEAVSVPVDAYACSVRALLQNWRQGTVACKARGDVSFSNKKPWKQKGTGRARAGSARSPLWRSGGTIFGPQPRVRRLRVNRKARSKVFLALMAQALAEKKVYCLEFTVDSSGPAMAAQARGILKKSGLCDRKLTVFLPSDDVAAYLAFRNMPKIRVVFFDQPDVYTLSCAGDWVFLKKDKKNFESMVGQWS